MQTLLNMQASRSLRGRINLFLFLTDPNRKVIEKLPKSPVREVVSVNITHLPVKLI